MSEPSALHYTQDAEANKLLAEDPLALLIGLVLYQQVPVEKAFAGPLELQRRLGSRLDASLIAGLDPEVLEMQFRQRPALHRFPANMAKRTQAVCAYLLEHHGGDPTALWTDVESARDLLKRVKALPGFGDYKARVYVGVLAKRFAITPKGWEEALPNWPSIADVAAPGDLADLKARKKAWKDRSKAG